MFVILLLILFLNPPPLPADEVQPLVASPLVTQPPVVKDGINFSFTPETKYKMIEKTNFSKRENGKYLGYAYREVRGLLTLSPTHSNKIEYEGKYYVFEEMKKENRLVAGKIDKVIPARFTVLADGTYQVPEDQVYPFLRSFPVFTSQAVGKGESWTAYGMRIVDPDREEKYTRVRFYCEYIYEGLIEYQGQMVHSIKAQYAMRYKQGDDPDGDKRLTRISGKHVVNILISSDSSSPLFMRDQMEEQYLYEDKRTLELSGFIITWFNDVVLLDKTNLVKTVIDDLDKSHIPDIQVEERPEGVNLTLQKIHFVTNEAQILPEEKSRLDSLAKILKNIPNRTFLVTGHTTDIGPKDFLYELSTKRAKAIVDALLERGIPAERLLYEGRGFSEPLVPNDTEENRTKNRRVELLILED
jgi:outer membrane protein OmpA-like peptidoglycan-associated protein